jgi:kynureninase
MPPAPSDPSRAEPGHHDSRGQQYGSTLEWARAADGSDPLRALRNQFALPQDERGAPLIYLCGHSLGLAPRNATSLVAEEMADWQRLGVEGHERARRPWIGYAERLQPLLATLAGAAPHEVVAMNSLTVNLHLLLASFYRPTPERHAVLIEAGAFSSDRHVVASQIAWHGFDPAAALLELAPRAGEDTLRIEDIESLLAREGTRIALVLWPGVQYRTGQAFDLARVTAAAHAAGCILGVDLAHAIGNLPLTLHESGADFAAWCSYKYLNGGPGALGGAFVHDRHLPATRAPLPRLAGWWGHRPDTRFNLEPQFHAAAGAAAWALSNPPILSSAPLLASLPLFEAAGMAALRAKSIALTGYLEFLLRPLSAAITVVTPANAAERGCQLSLRMHGGRAVQATLRGRGVVGDWREPDILRLAPAPLYNSFEDVWQAANALAAIVQAPRVRDASA